MGRSYFTPPVPSRAHGLPACRAYNTSMLRPEGYLPLLLRLEAVVLLCALLAAIMPTEWMASAHVWLGLGEMPRAPLVEYLTRSLSLLYATWVPILWLTAGDVRRYRRLIEVMAWTRFALGLALLVLDGVVGMPWFWLLAEGPSIMALSLVVAVLARRLA
jgi:hypothetical protein